MSRRRPKKPGKSKPTKAEAIAAGEDAHRIDTILRLRLDGAQLHDLLTFANDDSATAAEARGGEPWGIDADGMARLIARADDVLIARTEQRRERAVALQLARRDALFARAINAGDFGVALSILKDQSDLLGMYPKVAELRELVKEQDRLIAQLEAVANAPRQLGPATEGEGATSEADGGDQAGGSDEGREE